MRFVCDKLALLCLYNDSRLISHLSCPPNREGSFQYRVKPYNCLMTNSFALAHGEDREGWNDFVHPLGCLKCPKQFLATLPCNHLISKELLKSNELLCKGILCIEKFQFLNIYITDLYTFLPSICWT